MEMGITLVISIVIIALIHLWYLKRKRYATFGLNVVVIIIVISVCTISKAFVAIAGGMFGSALISIILLFFSPCKNLDKKIKQEFKAEDNSDY
jgi:hypothetical protein